MKRISDVRVIVTSTTVSFFDVTLNTVVAVLTGSTVMLSQALQGLSDLITGIILYIGVRRSQRKRDEQFQLGYGREIFFWVLIAGIMMFAGTGAASVYFGYQQIVDPGEIDTIPLALGMLVLSFCMNAYAFSLSFRRIRQQGMDTKWWRHLINSSIVETKASFVLDFLGTIGTVFGLTAIIAFVLTGDARFDGVGGLVIGLTMMTAAILLVRDVRDLIIGKSVDAETEDAIAAATLSVDGVNQILDLRTMYLGSAKLLVLIEVHLDDKLDTNTIERITDAIKDTVKQAVPIVDRIQVEIETPDSNHGERLAQP